MKGGKRENSGRKKGGKNQRTQEWEEFGKRLLGDKNLDRALAIMDKAKDDDFMKYFSTLSEYFKPKLARTELSGPDNGPIPLQVTRKILGNPNKPEPDLHSGTE